MLRLRIHAIHAVLTCLPIFLTLLLTVIFVGCDSFTVGLELLSEVYSISGCGIVSFEAYRLRLR